MFSRIFSRLFNSTARRFDGIDFLELVPEAVVHAEQDQDSQKTVLLIPRYQDAIWGRLIQPRLGAEKRFIRLPLDDRGTWLWPRLDGHRNIGNIVSEFEQQFPEDRDQAPERLSGYLYNFWENNFIKFNNLPDK